MENVWKLCKRMEKVKTDIKAIKDFMPGEDENQVNEVDEAIATCEYKLEQKRADPLILILLASLSIAIFMHLFQHSPHF